MEAAAPVQAPSQLAQAMRTWRERPNLFCRQVLRVVPDEWQDEVLEAVVAGALGVGNAINPEALRRIALKASKGPGKSTLESWIGWWYLACFPHPKVVGTSISGDNLRDGLWSEFAKWQKRSPLLSQAFTWTSERIFQNEHRETWWASARQWSRSATPEQQADTLAGLHADHVLILVDEGGGIPDSVVATAEGGLANANPLEGTTALLVLAGNPTHLTGPLYRACTRERRLWWIKEISGDPDDPKRAPRVSVQWAKEQIEKYGRDHPWVLVNVFGKFPPGSSNTLLGLEEVVASAARVLTEPEYSSDSKVVGVDVARFGDDETVILLRQGRACFQPRIMRNQNLMATAGQVAMVLDEHRPDACFIDSTGLGSGVVDRLHELHYQVIGVEFGGKPLRTHPKLLNRRTEMWWAMTEWVKKGGALPNDPTLISELPEPTYHFASNGAMCLESKDDMKARGVPSPNRADALALTFAAPVASREVRDRLESRQDAERQRYHPYRR